MRLPNLHQFFAEPKPIYVQNISNPIGVISLEFRSPNGEVYSYRVPANRNPIVLTNIIPFDAVKSSALFLSFLQKTPQGTGPHLQLLSEEEFNSYYSDKQAEIEANSVEELINEAQEKAAQFNDPSHKIVSEEEARPNQPIREGALGPEVSTRVIAVCQQLDPSNTNKVDAREAIDTFASLELTTIDYDYILKNCFDEVNKANGIVRKWAFARMKEVMGKMEDGIIRSEAAEKRTRLAK